MSFYFCSCAVFVTQSRFKSPLYAIRNVTVLCFKFVLPFARHSPTSSDLSRMG